MTDNEIQTNVDESVYEKPYLVKDGCLYEEVVTKNKTEHIKLADFGSGAQSRGHLR